MSDDHLINNLHCGVKFKTLCDWFLSKIAVYKSMVGPILPNPKNDSSNLFRLEKHFIFEIETWHFITTTYGHIIVHTPIILNIQALLHG